MTDQGLNFTDEQYSGEYRGKQRHDDDKDIVLQRAWDVGVSKIIITGIDAFISLLFISW